MQPELKTVKISLLLSLLTLTSLSAIYAANTTKKPAAQQADRIVVIKSERTLSLYAHDKLIKQYKVALGGEPVGAKQHQGDHKTPEGTYTIDSKNLHSHYHLGLHVSYPNASNREWAHKHHVDPGGAIMIHGLPPAFSYLGPLHRQYDWTDGCIAVDDAEIEEIWSMVPVGATIEIRP